MDIHLINRPDLPSAGAGETPIIAIAPGDCQCRLSGHGCERPSTPYSHLNGVDWSKKSPAKSGEIVTHSAVPFMQERAGVQSALSRFEFSPRLVRRSRLGRKRCTNTTHDGAGGIGYGESAGHQQLRQTQLLGSVLSGRHEYQIALLAGSKQRTDEGGRSIWCRGRVARAGHLDPQGEVQDSRP